MKIQILGTGCEKCHRLYRNAVQAVTELRLDAEVVKVSDIAEIIALGAMVTPAMLIDGQNILSGAVPPVEKIKTLISQSRS